MSFTLRIGTKVWVYGYFPRPYNDIERAGIRTITVDKFKHEMPKTVFRYWFKAQNSEGH